MSAFTSLDGDSIRDLVDVRDRYALLREAEREARHSYGGSMKFESRGEAEYLIRRPYASSTRKSYGRRTPETEETLRAFLAGQARVQDQISGLRQQLSDRAPILRARGLGRVPLLAARVLRKLDEIGWLGTNLFVVGTNALFAYEAAAALRIESAMLATGDVDVLYDARRRLRVSGDVDERGLIGVLRQVDRSFSRATNKTYTAANRDGYMIDLLEPQDHGRLMRQGPGRLSDNPEDLIATSTDSSRWLLNVPKFEAIAIDERGLPVRVVALDPRAFSLQKLWIARNDPTRDPAKRRRDEEQAHLVARIAVRHLGLSFDDGALSALPLSFRTLATELDLGDAEIVSDW